MKLYQPINIDNYDVIVSKVKSYLEKKELIFMQTFKVSEFHIQQKVMEFKGFGLK
jgi:hypothetical protein